MMGKIYARALNVKIWLGKEDKEPPDFTASLGLGTLNSVHIGASLGLGTMNSVHIGAYGRIPISLSFIAQALRNASGPKNRLAAIRPMEDSAHRNVAYGFPPPNAPEWDVVRDFFTNSWFERVWVVQEAVLASEATALIGDWEIEWAAIGQAAVWFQAKGYAMPAVLATNPVDKVYATFGMAEELAYMEENGFHELVEPNYTSKSVLDVYRDIARFLVIEHGNLAVLSHVGMSVLSDWPSWAPDWRHDKASNALSTKWSAGAYNTGGDQSLAIGISNDVNTLSLQGIETDTIAAYGDRLASYGFGYVTYQEEIDFVKMAWALFMQRPLDTSASDTDDGVANTFIHTLTAGLSNTNKLASEDPTYQADALYWFAQHAPHMLPGISFSQRLKWSIKQRPDPGRFHEAFVRACVDRRFFVTRDGSMGIGPDAMKQGDVIVVLFGGRVPYLLRALDTGYRFLGECYVPGLMDGEAVRTWKDEGSKRVFFELV
ncbi:hypothetical protein P153DRAFT_325963 [Dothidotthia symphoricarpi CBS 119687]|uniref:Uncharacterized protein n=1 Tax=Dothidotthia symphoricarpi CBS 119687 TaxID=1392245 RepID=A0A6A6A0K2_9PLEO|nr:uncharacterized protein P153DRAFT_325963 [Dothidotthia symphoricarpi CBS 119687]KAF2124673.1 hypothetical protein P153DRAFT_325963 [Dothidotthia symphoricarpi CBS 119687]